MITQLRRYEIEPGKLNEFVEWFPALLAPRAQYGLTLDWAYADHENSEFVWSTSYDGDLDAFKAAVTTYEASDERKAAYGGYKPPVTKLNVSIVEVLNLG